MSKHWSVLEDILGTPGFLKRSHRSVSGRVWIVPSGALLYLEVLFSELPEVFGIHS